MKWDNKLKTSTSFCRVDFRHLEYFFNHLMSGKGNLETISCKFDMNLVQKYLQDRNWLQEVA